MIFAILFEDDEQYSDQRSVFMSKHLAFLSSNDNTIQAAGPLIDATNGDQAGGLWLVEANNNDEVLRLIENDPFWPTGLRKSYTILEWKQVFYNKKVLI